ncbi:hypothetical protein LTR17_019643 [Elasticomyces elasticus]|nr:hypothetical protein LTR17_019643 [Elasticomyces elasticus]
MATSASHNCKVCNQDTSKRCTGCRGGLDANLKLAPAYYCGIECQKTDWNDHKELCKLANDRKVLKRVAFCVLNTFCAIRVVAFDLKIEKVEVKAGKLHVYEGQYENEDILVDFPEKIPSDWSPLSGDDLRALWMWCACSDALFAMNKMVESALQGVCSRVEEIRLAVDPSKNRIIMHGSRSYAELEHVVFCVTLRDGERYALDLTGAQYGQYRPVMWWATCMRILDAKLLEILPLGTAVTRRGERIGYLNEMTAKGPVQVDQQAIIFLTHYWLADIFNISFFTKPRLESNPEVARLLMRSGDMSMGETGALAKLLRGNDDECLDKANYLALNAAMDVKAFAKLIGSYGGYHRLPRDAAIRYFDIRDNVLKGRDLQAELHAGEQEYQTGVVTREQDIQAALRAALDEESTQEEYLMGGEIATQEKGKVQNKFSGQTALIALEKGMGDMQISGEAAPEKDGGKEDTKQGHENAPTGSPEWMAAFQAKGGKVYSV